MDETGGYLLGTSEEIDETFLVAAELPPPVAAE
jgi:hypothetical protein